MGFFSLSLSSLPAVWALELFLFTIIVFILKNEYTQTHTNLTLFFLPETGIKFLCSDAFYCENLLRNIVIFIPEQIILSTICFVCLLKHSYVNMLSFIWRPTCTMRMEKRRKKKEMMKRWKGIRVNKMFRCCVKICARKMNYPRLCKCVVRCQVHVPGFCTLCRKNKYKSIYKFNATETSQ